MILITTGRWGVHTPERPGEAIFSPARLICLHCRTRLDCAGMPIRWSMSTISPVRVSHLCKVRNVVIRRASRTPLCPWPSTSALHITRRFVPYLTPRAPALEHLMVDHVHRRRCRHVAHLPHPCQADASQAQIAIGTGHDPMLHDLRGYPSATRPIVLGCALLPRRLSSRAGFFTSALTQAGWRRLLFFPFFDPSQRSRSSSCVCCKASCGSCFFFRR